MSRAVIILNGIADRSRASKWIASAPPGTRVEFKEAKRSTEQNARLWAMLTEVARQIPWHGIRLSADDWKLLFLDGLKREIRMVPNLDGNGFVSLGRSSSDLSVGEMSDLMELISEFGARHGVKFNEPSVSSPADDSDAAVHGADAGAVASLSQSGDDAIPVGAGEAPADAPSLQSAGADLPRLAEFARRIAAVIGDDHRVVTDEARTLASELGIPDEGLARDKARSIVRYAVKACGNYGKLDGLPLDDALDMIAGVAGIERKELER